MVLTKHELIVLSVACVIWTCGCLWLFFRSADVFAIVSPTVSAGARDPSDRALLWLLATPASDGSAVALLLMQMGALAHADNETLFQRGFEWASGSANERRDVARAEKSVLNRTALPGDTRMLGLGVDATLLPADVVAEFRRRADPIVDRVSRTAGALRRNWLLHSAHGATLAPLWRESLESLDLAKAAVCVFAYRDPLAHARDIHFRFFDNRLDGAFWRWVWVAQELSALSVCNRTQRFVAVDVDELRRDPRATARSIVEQLRALGVGGLRADRAKLEPAEASARRTLPAAQTAEHALPDAEETVLSMIRGEGAIAAHALRNRVAAARSMALEQVRLRLARAHKNRTESDLRPFYAARAAPDNTVVALYTNDAFVGMAMNALCSMDLVSGLRERVVVLALDPAVCYSLRRFAVPCVYKEFREIARPKALSREQLWTKKKHSAYWVLLALKMAYLRDVLAAGHDVLLADADVVFFADVRQRLADEAAQRGVDLLIQSDARSKHNETLDWVCAGFLYARASPRMVAFVDEALRLMTITGAPDQDVLQLMLTGHAQWYDFDNASDAGSALPPRFETAESLGVSFRVLDLKQWPNGKDLDRVPFWARPKARDRQTPLILHANMRVKDKKIPALQQHKMWFVDRQTEGCNFTDWSSVKTEN
jgi:hypothetical protein